MPGEGVECGPAAGHQITTLLRALTGIGAHRAEIVVAAGRRQNESDTAFGNAAGAGQAIGRDSGVCVEIR